MKTLVRVWKDHKMACLTLLLVACLIPAAAFGWAVPAAGDFGFEFYDFAVNTFLQGAFGRIIMVGMALGGLVVGISARAGGWATGIPLMVIAGALYNIDNLATPLGWMF